MPQHELLRHPPNRNRRLFVSPGHEPASISRGGSMSHRVSAALGRCLELERVIISRFHSGSLGLDDVVMLFDELLLVARPASVHAFNKLLTVVSRAQGRGSSTSVLVVSLFNRMARAFPNKVAPDGFTTSPTASSSVASAAWDAWSLVSPPSASSLLGSLLLRCPDREHEQ